MDAKKLLDSEIERVKEMIDECEEDIEHLIELEREHDAREDLIAWLEKKKRYRELLEDEGKIKNLLSHLEHAYRTASVSEDAYNMAKEANKRLLKGG